jgi:hypothetical protein
MKQETLEEAAEKYNSQFVSQNEFSIEDFINGAKWQQEQDKNKYSEKDLIEFSEWVSHNDWVYLPRKSYWVNEEQEELEQKFTTKELFEQFKNK